MCYKPRAKPMEAIILEFLNGRMFLAEKDKQRLHYLVKGYEGEVMFDALTEKLHCQRYTLNDLLLDSSGSTFQIDSLMVTQEPLYLFEVKNFEGDYFYENGRFHLVYKDKEIKNPLQQLERSESLLRQFLQNLGYKLPIEAYVVFINPEFHLYQAPQNLPIIYPNQLNRFMNKVNKRPSTLNGFHKKLADQLVSMHQVKSPNDKLPPYDYAGLKKGNLCAACHSLKTSVVERKLFCDVCGHIELLDHAVLRGVEELRLLFPGMKITTVVVYDWCGMAVSMKTIRRVLMQNLRISGKTKGSFFM
ncbi:nuclease-related domain-containing protein [Neobacillus sp. OS1-2]|uniref:nuclease-related domain-containing protein n=1 Tax=Neobacillus sp. OS1-2 TaxID=3070680 RepID=UPI0027E11AA7|nr:nuclease-related domain-containing protein [Neobacillus sp. OS1-2]WML41069.1 nuclease-related domain-containing protein [Neobacillus sp. OS1-2]